MSQVAATITDAADIRSYDCLLPDHVEVSRIAIRLAELMHLPMVGPDGCSMIYGLIPKGGSLLDGDATFTELNLPCPLTLRLVPEISAAKDNMYQSDDTDVNDSNEDIELDIVIGEPVALVHDAELDSRPDVRIDAEVHKAVEEFAATNRNKECAGLLLGTVDSEGKGRIIHITAAIPAEGAVGTRASVRIPIKAWEAMLRIRDFDHGDLRILGWFHTHAGWGVFMSDSDIFIHRHFFPHPNMVAYVLDPTTGRDGFFYWHEGKIGLCPSYGLVGKPKDVKPHKSHEKQATKEKKIVRPDIRNWIIAALVLGVLYLAFAGSPVVKHAAHKKITSLDSQRRVVVTREIHKKEINKAPVSPDRVYVIGPKDNPWSICNRIYKNGDLGPALMRYNAISGVTKLQIGKQIKIPSKEKLQKLRKK